MKRIFALVLALCMIFALSACGAQKASGANLTFTTGGDQGTYYGFGSVIGEQVSSTTDTKVTTVTSGGSKANIEEMDAGNAQLGFVQSDVMAYAFKGERLFDKAIDSFSVVAALYMEQVQIVTLDPEIKTVADLAGKKVSIGAQGSGVYFNAIDVLGCYDLTEKDIDPTYQSFGDSADALKDGKIDAAFVVAGAPTAAITDLATSKSVYLVSLDEEHIDKLIAASPFYSKNVIAADTYAGVGECTTVAVGAVVIARDDVPEDAIYNFISATFNDLDGLAKGHAKASELSLDFAASVTAVPYHAGAAKYLAEQGFNVPIK